MILKTTHTYVCQIIIKCDAGDSNSDIRGESDSGCNWSQAAGNKTLFYVRPAILLPNHKTFHFTTQEFVGTVSNE